MAQKLDDARRAPRRSGKRTTLRVPDELQRSAEQLAAELGTSTNDALVRLATAGASLLDRARELATKRDARWGALVAAMTETVGGRGDYPSIEDMREAALSLRRHADSS